MYVYLIKNRINDKCYVGQTTISLEKRWQAHCWSSSAINMLITKAIKKYKKQNFEISLLETCTNQENLNEKEQVWINKLNTLFPNGYNLTTGGKGRGHLSEETRRKIGAGNKGKIRSAETIRKLSESHKGWIPSEQTKAKWKKSFAGKRGSDLCYERARLKSQKTYVLYNPEGQQLSITNLKQFCKNHNLCYPKMNSVVNNKKLHYKGWTLDSTLHIKARKARQRYKTDRYYYTERTK